VQNAALQLMYGSSPRRVCVSGQMHSPAAAGNGLGERSVDLVCCRKRRAGGAI
jgi:hypothetical protein